MATKIQLRKGTAIAWSSANPILSDAEVGVEQGTLKFKIGDGLTLWNDLAYAGGAGDMYKFIYDSNDNGKVDIAELAEAVEWIDILNKPDTLPTIDQKDALEASNNPSALNKYLTFSDLTGALPTGEIPNNFINYDSDTQGSQITTSGSFVDINDMDISVTITSVIPVAVSFSYTCSKTNGNKTVAAFRILRVGSNPESVSLGMQVEVSSNGDRVNGSVTFRTPALPIGTHIFRPQFRVVSGSGNIDFLRGQHFIQAQQAPKGDSGEGIPTGGLTDQYLVKLSNVSFDTEWRTLSIDWSSITSIPADFIPSVHNHEISEINGLTTFVNDTSSRLTTTETNISTIFGNISDINSELSDKSEIGHLHDLSDINGLVTALSLKENINNKGIANGYASLDSNGKIPTSMLPALAITDTFVVSSQVNMLGLTAEKGDVVVRTDLNKSFILRGDNPSEINDWQELLTPTDTVLSVNGFTGSVSLTTSNINEGTNLYYTENRVSLNADVVANTTARHAVLTIGTANGLSLSNQQLSLDISSSTSTGALNSTDWNTFNNKANPIVWTELLNSSQAVINNGYITFSTSQIEITLPSSASVGSIINVIGKGSGGWKILQNASQKIFFSKAETTIGVTGYLESTNRRDVVYLVCTSANNEWTVVSSVGNIMIA